MLKPDKKPCARFEIGITRFEKETRGARRPKEAKETNGPRVPRSISGYSVGRFSLWEFFFLSESARTARMCWDPPSVFQRNSQRSPAARSTARAANSRESKRARHWVFSMCVSRFSHSSGISGWVPQSPAIWTIKTVFFWKSHRHARIVGALDKSDARLDHSIKIQNGIPNRSSLETAPARLARAHSSASNTARFWAREKNDAIFSTSTERVSRKPTHTTLAYIRREHTPSEPLACEAAQEQSSTARERERERRTPASHGQRRRSACRGPSGVQNSARVFS